MASDIEPRLRQCSTRYQAVFLAAIYVKYGTGGLTCPKVRTIGYQCLWDLEREHTWGCVQHGHAWLYLHLYIHYSVAGGGRADTPAGGGQAGCPLGPEAMLYPGPDGENKYRYLI
jgi:hypothetical protein